MLSSRCQRGLFSFSFSPYSGLINVPVNKTFTTRSTYALYASRWTEIRLKGHVTISTINVRVKLLIHFLGNQKNVVTVSDIVKERRDSNSALLCACLQRVQCWRQWRWRWRKRWLLSSVCRRSTRKAQAAEPVSGISRIG